MAERTRQESREAFILHGYPYRERACCSRRLPGHSDGCRWWRGERAARARPCAGLARLQPLALSWFGKGELRTLARASGSADNRFFAAKRSCAGSISTSSCCGFSPAKTPMTPCFRDTGNAPTTRAAWQLGPALRSFERALLKELGYAMALERDSASGRAIDRQRAIRTIPSAGRSKSRARERSPRVRAGAPGHGRATTTAIPRPSNRRRR